MGFKNLSPAKSAHLENQLTTLSKNAEKHSARIKEMRVLLGLQMKQGLSEIPLVNERVSLNEQCSAAEESSALSAKMDIIRPLQKYSAEGEWNDRTVLIIPMQHPTPESFALNQRELLRSAAECQSEMFQYLFLQQRYGLRIPVNFESQYRQIRNDGTVFLNILDNGQQNLYDQQTQDYLFEHPKALIHLFHNEVFEMDDGRRTAPTVDHVLANSDFLGAGFQYPDTQALLQRYQNLSFELTGLPRDSMAQKRKFIEARECHEALCCSMEQSFVRGAEDANPNTLYRVAMGQIHAEPVRRALCQRGWNVWIAFPASAPQKFNRSLEEPFYKKIKAEIDAFDRRSATPQN